MSRSRRKHPYHGFACCQSEKWDKRYANRRLRHVNRLLLKRGVEMFALLREVSSVWLFGKDGRTRFNPELFPNLLRK